MGDPHGCASTLRAMLSELRLAYGDSLRIIITGDIIDRGPDAFDCWRAVREWGCEVVLGNHEWMMLEAEKSPEAFNLWIYNGANATLRSVSLWAQKLNTQPSVLLEQMRQWARTLPLYVEVPLGEETLLVSHAGVARHFARNWQEAFSYPLDNDDSVIWNRGELAQLPGIIQVVGHTPVSYGPAREGKNWYVDTGCVYRWEGTGYLSALVFIPPHTNPVLLSIKRQD